MADRRLPPVVLSGGRFGRPAPIQGQTAHQAQVRSRQVFSHPFKRLDVKMTLGVARCRTRASGARRFLSGPRREFPTIGPGQNLSSARVEP